MNSDKWNYLCSEFVKENPEFIAVELDEEDKVLEGMRNDGTKVIGGDLTVGGSANINGDIRVLGNMEVSGVLYKVIENPEYLAAWVDAEDRVVFGLKTNGKTYISDADFLKEIKSNQDAIAEIRVYLANFDSLDINALTSITAVETPEYIGIVTDSEDKVLAGRTPDGAAFENVGFSTPKVSIDGHIIENIEDREGRVEIITDFEGKIVSYYKKDGIRVESAGIELSQDGYSALGEALKEYAHIEHHDWSNEKFVEIPIPKCCAIINFGVDVQANSKSSDIRTYIQYWDKDGNYFKKNIVLNAQGASSMQYQIKNQGFDLDDGSEIKFGDWCPMDSFHIKNTLLMYSGGSVLYVTILQSRCIRQDLIPSEGHGAI